MTRDPQRPTIETDACPGCLRLDDEHDADCPLVWWLTWEQHRDGAPPELEEDG